MNEELTNTAAGAAFDRAQALAGLGGDLGMLRELVELFLEVGPEMVEELRQAVAAADPEALGRAVHLVKGAVGVIVAPPCRIYCPSSSR